MVIQLFHGGVMQEPTPIFALGLTDHNHGYTSVYAEAKQGPDWNPRTLSSFSTFGSSGPSLGLKTNGDVNSSYLEDSPPTSDKTPHPISPLPTDVPSKIVSSTKKLTNGIKHQSPVIRKVEKKANYQSSDHSPYKSHKYLDKPAVGGEIITNGNGVKLNSSSNDVDDLELSSETPSDDDCEVLSQIINDVKEKCDNYYKMGKSPEVRSCDNQSDVLLKRPDLLIPASRHSHFNGFDGSTSKLVGTPIAPPIVPKHAYSKSLVGEVNTAIRPCHSHSRSLVEDQLVSGRSANFKDGLGLITLFLGPSDRRYGFSVVGGVDEGFPPRIDEIANGSPADKADLEVGDEILEVNGKSLEDASHTEVISHIHQCIRSRTICLRVKRRTGNKLAADLAASSNVQDAFVIAVEQRARERLERLSALKKIKPVDISKLSSQLSEPAKGEASSHQSPSVSSRTANSDRDSSREDVNGVFENHSPIYVTSVPNLTTSATQAERIKVNSSQGDVSKTTSTGHLERGKTEGSSERLKSETLSDRGKSDSQSERVRSENQSDQANRTRSRSSTPKRGSSSSSPRHRPYSPTKSPSPLKENKHHRTTSGRKGRGSSIGSHPSPLENDLDAGNKSGDELELTHDLDDDDGYSEEGGEGLLEGEKEFLNTTGSEDDIDEDVSESGEDSLPATPEKTYGVPFANAPQPPKESRREVLIDSSKAPERPKSPLEQSESLESKDSSSSRKSGGSGSSNGTGHSTGGSKSYASHRGSLLGSETDNMISMVEFDPSNKEMAVDVPDTFIARTKTPPRYPPPKTHGSFSNSSPIHHNNNNHSNSSKTSSRKGRSGSGSSGSVTPVSGTLPKQISPPRVPEVPKQHPQVVVQSPNTQEEINKIKKYEEELKVRREREEAELQRTSIRGSQKLQALASYPQGQPRPSPTGAVNEGFDKDELNNYQDDKGASPSINELIQSLQRIQNVLKSNGHRISEDMTLVAQLLVNPEFQKVLAVHNKVQETWCLNRPPTPFTHKSQELASECVELLKQSSAPEAMELVELLSKYAVEGLFYAHDRIADSDPPFDGLADEINFIGLSVDSTQSNSPVATAHPLETTEDALMDRPPSCSSNYPEQNVHIVRIDKTNEPLGATIRNEGDSVIIGRIVQGGAAEKSKLLHEGDEILEVNGVRVRTKSVNDVCDMLAGMTGTLTFIIVPGAAPVPPASVPPPSGQSLHVKAFFDYDPEEDMYIPCRELGMSFQKGDILHVINQTDANWWQAYRDGEEDQTLAGLVPSKTFQQQREAMRQTVVGDGSNKDKSKKGKLLCAKKHQKKKKKKMLYPNYNDDYDAEEILTYEPVDLYYPRANRKRPIVLIGPPNIGRHELRQKLMEDRERFAAAVPHTSRPKRDRELDGADYHFISRTQFEADILARKFVEHGEYEKAYYGTSLDAIRAVVNSGKICVLNLHPLSLKMLKNSDLKPYVVLIAPPSLEKLRQKKAKAGEPVKEEELKEIIQKAREMEDQYGHYFDLVLINQEIERTYQQLIHEINVLEREPQWVPASWLENER